MLSNSLSKIDVSLPRANVSEKMADALNKTCETLRMSNLKLPFPWKLLRLLEDTESGSNEHVVSWLPDGTGFKIHNEAEFCEKVLKAYFNQAKLKSFTRQLYLYGFVKISAGPNEGAFTHPKFRRNDKDACLAIRRNQFAGDRRQTKKARRDTWLAGAGSVMSSSDDESTERPVRKQQRTTKRTKKTKAALNLFNQAFHLFEDDMPEDVMTDVEPITSCSQDELLSASMGVADVPSSDIAFELPWESAPTSTETSDDWLAGVEGMLSQHIGPLQQDDSNMLSIDLSPRPIEEMLLQA